MTLSTTTPLEIALGVGEPLTESAITSFLDRIGANPDGDLALHLVLNRPHSLTFDMDYTIRRDVIPTVLTAALHRLVNLVIECGDEANVLNALTSGPAPRLERFWFCTPSYSLPATLFAGQAPVLQDVFIDCCDFPETGFPVFTRVRKLTCDFKTSSPMGSPKIHPERFFTSCPALQELTIAGNYYKVRNAPWEVCDLQAVAQLRRVTVTQVYDAIATRTVVQALSRAHTAAVNVDTAYTSRETLELMLEHLSNSPRLGLCILYIRERLYCSVVDAGRTRERRMSHLLGDDRESLLHGPGGRLEALRPCFADIAYRFSHLYISAHEAAWDFLLEILGDSILTNVETLTVLPTSEGFEHMEVNGTLPLPSLKWLELLSKEKVLRVRETALVNLVRSLSFSEPFPLRQKLVLIQRNVEVHGDLGTMDVYFRCV